MRFLAMAVALLASMQGQTHARALNDPFTCLTSFDGQTALLPGFVPAKAIQKTAPSYPKGMEEQLGEGWVVFDFHVSQAGEVQELELSDRLGSQAFVDAAEKAVRSWRYQPATLNGVAITQYTQRASFEFRFPKEPKPSAEHALAVEQYQTARRALLNGEAAKAITILEAALAGVDGKNSMNLYEQSKFSLMLATAYYVAKNYPRAHLHAGRAAFADGEFLEPADAARANRLFHLLSIEAGGYAPVLCGKPKPQPPQSGDDIIAQPTLDALEAEVIRVASVPGTMAVPATIGPLGAGKNGWRHRLIRRTFAFADIQGDVGTFKLTCTTKIMSDTVNDKAEWSVPDSAGVCYLLVDGAPGATFKLLQAW